MTLHKLYVHFHWDWIKWITFCADLKEFCGKTVESYNVGLMSQNFPDVTKVSHETFGIVVQCLQPSEYQIGEIL